MGAWPVTPKDCRLGKLICLAREERNLSRDELGAMLGISPEQVKRFEEDRDRMPPGLLYRLSELLELPVTAFFRD